MSLSGELKVWALREKKSGNQVVNELCFVPWLESVAKAWLEEFVIGLTFNKGS